MPKYQYQLSSQTRWMSSSGNALLAFYNKNGSGKKVNVHSIEIYNNTTLMKATAADTNAPAPTKLKLIRPTTANDGESLVPGAVDSDSPAWPATVKCSFGGAVTPSYVQVGSSLTMAGATAGSTTFTPGVTPSPAWTTNEHRSADRYLKVDSGGNAGVYEIASNSATALTLTSPFSATESTTGYLAEVDTVIYSGLLKMARTDTTAAWAVTNFGMVNRRRFQTGNIYENSVRTDTQAATVRAGEKMCLVSNFVNTPMPLFISVVLIREGSPDRTYVLEYFTKLTGQYDAALCINNEAESGEVIYVASIQVSEVGTMDTPYFQVVPISQVNAAAAADPTRSLMASVFPSDTSSPSLDADLCEVYTDVGVSASGVPSSYIAEGSTAVPKGFNYLSTKDFIGPTYMTMFSEGAAFKIDSATFWSNRTPGTYGSHLSQVFARVKGFGAPIVIREGEGVAIVSGAETAAGTINSVGMSGWQNIDFAVTFSIENATTPALVLTGLQSGSEVLVLDASTGGSLASEENNLTGTFTYEYEYSPGLAVDVIVHSLGYEYYRIDNVALSTTGVTIPVSQRVDRNYAN